MPAEVEGETTISTRHCASENQFNRYIGRKSLNSTETGDSPHDFTTTVYGDKLYKKSVRYRKMSKREFDISEFFFNLHFIRNSM